MKYDAVIFDFFGTLVPNFSLREHQDILRQMAAIVSAPANDFLRLWLDTFDRRATGTFPGPEANIEYICHELGVPVEHIGVEQAARVRSSYTAQAITPRPEAIATLSCLKSSGYRTGIISDCSAELPAIFQDTPFAPLVDVPVFSCVAGMRKPDRRIYQKAATLLGVAPQACLYVGDGSSQELTGASRVGMHAVLLCLPDEDGADEHRIDSEEWHGPTISSLTDVLRLVR